MIDEQLRSVKASAPAKVNLALRVGAPRADGFHPLDTVFEALDLFDDVEAILGPGSAVTMEIHGLGEDLPIGESNLVIRAARILQKAANCSLGAHLKVTKRIPVAGGMAGGSADAAATLIALNELWQLRLNQAQLVQLGAQLGSDVPFALMGTLARGTSRGESLVPITPKSMHGWVILTNPQGLSTPLVFKKFDELVPDAPQLPASTQPVLDALATGSLPQLAAAFENDLWEPAAALRPDLAEIFAVLASSASSASSGSSVPSGSAGLFSPADVSNACESDGSADRAGESAQCSGGSAHPNGGSALRRVQINRVESDCVERVNDCDRPDGRNCDHGSELSKESTGVCKGVDTGEAAIRNSSDGVGLGRILSGSGPSIAILCEIAQVDEVAAIVRRRFPNYTVVTAIGPAVGAHLR